MEQQIIDFIHGYVRIRISGTSCDRFLNLCAFHEICLWNLLPVDGGFEAFVARTDFFRLKDIVKKSHTHILITKRYGLPFFIHKYRGRWACMTGAAAAGFLMFWLSAHIWNISIDGNLSQTDDVILEYLENEGISHGMWKNQIDTLELSDQIRNYFSGFSWVSAELKGTRLIIYVKEGILKEDEEPSRQEMIAENGIAASKAGTVLSLYVRRGLSAVAVGDTVEAGDLLVSGEIPVYNDDGDIISWQSVYADADILLRTETEYYKELDYETTLKYYTGREKIRYGLCICGKFFSLPVIDFLYDFCDTTCEITQVKLSENYYLPIYYYKYTAREYENLKYSLTKEQAKSILESDLLEFEQNLEEKGVQIFQNDVTITLYENTAVADGVLITDENATVRTEEMITELQEE
ncbi:MAG: sporulation protein YqfD [Lachnospiraceae bacterium]|nr:sporulation protein YqfD [Lachnospiraceae bacterium]